MKRTLVTLLVLTVGLFGIGCVNGLPGTSGSASASGSPGSGSSSGDLDEGGGGNGSDSAGEDDDSGDGTAGQPVPSAGIVNARVRNLSDMYADVTLRFLLGDIVVHLTFLRVPAHTSTMVIGPEVADRLEVTAVAQDGSELPAAVFLGVDLGDGGEAVYVIGAGEPPPDVPPTLTFIVPTTDVEVSQGGQLEVVIEDEDPDSAATISFFLDPDDEPLGGDEIILGSGFSEDPDGKADAFTFTLGADVPPGEYRLLGVIADALSTDIVQAPGLVRVVALGGDGEDNANDQVDEDNQNEDEEGNENEDEEEEEDENVAPTLAMTEPATDITVFTTQSFTTAWIDQDPDDNATISIYLDPNDAAFDDNEILVASSLEEDPDGPGDRTVVPLAGVASGSYRVIGLIDDGEASAVSVAPGRVNVLTASGGEGEGEGEPETLAGYWHFEFNSLPGCEFFEWFLIEIRYLRFDEDNGLIETWIETNDQHLRVNYPSSDGPSYLQLLGLFPSPSDPSPTEDTSRIIQEQSFDPLSGVLYVNEYVNSPAYEVGETHFQGSLDATGTGLNGEWRFDASHPEETTVCGTFTASRLPGLPPDLPYLIDLQPTDLLLSTTDLITPGSVEVTRRDYRVRYSMFISPVQVEYLLSDDAVADAEDLVIGSEVLLADPDGWLGLHSGAGPSLAIPADLPLSCESYVLIRLDAADTEGETDEDNNVLAVPVTVSQDGDPACSVGACCASDGSCTEIEEAFCTGEFQGPGTDCASVNCYTACCVPDGNGGVLCIDWPLDVCLEWGGEPLGIGTDCQTSTCPQPDQACCFPDGSCQELPPIDCNTNGGVPQGAGVDCEPNPCPQPETEACCFPDGTCEELLPSDCNTNGGQPQGEDTDCDPNPCPQPETEACCFSDGHCEELLPSDCNTNGGLPQGEGTDCDPNPCPQPTMLLGADVNSGGLWELDETGAEEDMFIGCYGSEITDVVGLAQVPSIGPVVYGVVSPGESRSELVTIDVDSGQIDQFIGAIGDFTSVSGLTVDPNNWILYGVTREGLLLTIDLLDAAPAFVSEVAYNLESVAYDETTQGLYAIANAEDTAYAAELYWIDPEDPYPILLGELTGYAEVGGLCARDGALYAVTRNDTQRLLRIDVSPLAVTDLRGLPSDGFNGLAFFENDAPAE